MSAKRIVQKIIDDLSGRAGIGNEWDSISGDIKQEIITEWVNIIEAGIDGEDHWVDYGKPEGYICSCPVGQDHERPKVN